MTGRYYIRVRGRKHGPLTVDQLHSLARRGRFARHYEVSTDGKNWRQAADFPELFARAAEEEDEFGDGGTDDEFDIGEGQNNPPPRPEKRRRPSSRSDNEDDPVPPPALDFDDLFSTDPDPNSRRRPVRGRPTPATPRRSIPLADDSEDDFDADEPAPRENVSHRHRSTERSTAPLPDDMDIPLWEPLEESPRRARQRQKQQQKPAKSAPAPKKVSDESDEESEEEPAAEKKGGGFFGFFRGKSAAEDALPEHLRELNERSARLPRQNFGLDKILLIGSRGQELPVVGHADSGDGIQTLGLLVP